MKRLKTKRSNPSEGELSFPRNGGTKPVARFLTALLLCQMTFAAPALAQDQPLQPDATAPDAGQALEQDNIDQAVEQLKQQDATVPKDNDDTPAEPGAPDPGENTPAGRSEIIKQTTAPVDPATTPNAPPPPEAPKTAPGEANALPKPPASELTKEQAPTAAKPVVAPPPAYADPVATLEELVKQNVIPADLAQRQTVNRAELASIIVKVMEFKTDLVSEFPVYRDIPVDHPYYGVIEVTRQKKIIRHDDEDGFYHPEATISYLDIYRAIANSLGNAPLTDEKVDELLQPYPDQAEIPYEDRQLMAQLVANRFFPYYRNEPPQPMKPNEVATPDGLAPLVGHLLDITHQRLRVRPDRNQVQSLPSGLVMTLTPTSAIFKERLRVGESVAFNLVDPVGPLPKAATFRGRVVEANGDNNFQAELLFIRTPNGEYYRTLTRVTIAFPRNDKNAFIVPGDVFQGTSDTPRQTVAQPAETPGADAQPGAKQEVILPTVPTDASDRQTDEKPEVKPDNKDPVINPDGSESRATQGKLDDRDAPAAGDTTIQPDGTETPGTVPKR